jgi:hypothetical protein
MKFPKEAVSNEMAFFIRVHFNIFIRYVILVHEQKDQQNQF